LRRDASHTGPFDILSFGVFIPKASRVSEGGLILSVEGLLN